MADSSDVTWHTLQFLGVATCLSQPAISLYMSVVGQYSTAALVPYIVGLILVATPILLVQLFLGSRSAYNVVNLFAKKCAILRGVGIVCLIRNFIWATVLSVYAARVAIYHGQSFSKPFAWGRCDMPWSMKICDPANTSFPADLRSPEVQFLIMHVMHLSPKISQEISLPLLTLVCLAAVWLVTFLLVCGGTKAFGWLMMVLGQAGVVLAVGLFAYGWEEHSSASAEASLYKNKWSVYAQSDQAAGMLSKVLQTLSTATFLWTGVLPTIGKYIGDTKQARYTSWIPIFIMAGVIPHIFLHLFHIYLMGAAEEMGLPPTQHHDPMVAMTWAFRVLDSNRGVAVSFFTLILICYLQTLALLTWVCVENIYDGMVLWQRKAAKNPNTTRILLSVACCACGLGFSLPMATQAGPYLVELVASFMDIFLPIFILISTITYAFVFANWKAEKRFVTSFTVWIVVAGIFLAAMDGYRVVTLLLRTDLLRETEMPVGRPYRYPLWAYILGWLVAGGPLVLGLFCGALHALGAAKDGRLKILRNKLIQGRRSINSWPLIMIPFITIKRREKRRAATAFHQPEEDGYMQPTDLYETISAGSRLDAHMAALQAHPTGLEGKGPAPMVVPDNQMMLKNHHILRRDTSWASSGHGGPPSIQSIPRSIPEEPTRQRPSYLLY